MRIRTLALASLLTCMPVLAFAAEEPDAPAAEEAEAPPAEEAEAPPAEEAEAPPAEEAEAPSAEEAPPAKEPAAPAAEEATGYRDVDLVDGGRTKMEDKRDYNNLIVLGVGFFPNTAKLRYRRVISDRVSVMVGGGYGRGSSELFSYDVSRAIGLGGADFHPIGNGLHGFYIGPRVKYTSWNFTMTVPDPDVDADPAAEEPATVNAFWNSGKVSLKVLLGYRVVIDPGLSVAIGLGPKYVTKVVETGDESLATFRSGGVGIGMDLELLLGWAF
jgi:hypothetical protein